MTCRLLVLLAILATICVQVNAQDLYRDFSKRISDTNNLGYWSGGADYVRVSDGIRIRRGGWFSDVIAPERQCADVTGKAIKINYHSDDGKLYIEYHQRNRHCTGPVDKKFPLTVRIDKGDGSITIPLKDFAGADPKLGFAFAVSGPVVVKSWKVVNESNKCIHVDTSKPGCSADRVCADGLCCSIYNYCGSTDGHCKGANCVSQCDMKAIPGLKPCEPLSISDGSKTPSAPSTSAPPSKWKPETDLSNPSFHYDEYGMRTSCGWPGMVAPTYDDGPHPLWTPVILQALKAAKIKTTFFMIGQMMLNNMEMAKRVVREGHHIASHTTTHLDLTHCNANQLEYEIFGTEYAFLKAIGRRPRYFRPPYGSMNKHVMHRLKELGYEVVYWNLDTNDWRTEVTEKMVVDTYKNGLKHPESHSYIVLQHDIQQKSAAVASQVYATIDRLGFRAVTMSECTNGEQYQEPEEKYTRMANNYEKYC